MADNVFANGMEVSCKAGPGKSICAFPDVCFTPPQTPATPAGVPIPYPNTSMNSDCTEGSSSVNVSNQEVMLKNKSYFKKSTGDEAGCAPKKGMITSTNAGKVYFTAWSMDVKIEGENVVRHLDVTTHNHSNPANEFAPWPDVSKQSVAPTAKTKPCHASCKKKKVSKKSRKKLRKTKEYRAAAAKVNTPAGKPKRCPVCENMFPQVSPDHMLPLDHIVRMPGFACLPKSEQSKIANHPDNMVPMCDGCNKSKQNKSYPAWKGKTGNKPMSRSTLEASTKRQKRLEKDTQKRINNAPCK
jgi:hypothetical protein